MAEFQFIRLVSMAFCWKRSEVLMRNLFILLSTVEKGHFLKDSFLFPGRNCIQAVYVTCVL